MARSQGRVSDKNKGGKKDKSPGPTTYKWESSINHSSLMPRSTMNILFSGMGAMAGGKDNIKHVEKLKIKSNRCFDEIQRQSKKIPGVGQYKTDKS